MAIPEITVDELADRMAAGAVVVDVRQPDEYTDGHVPGARLVPLNEVPDALDQFPRDVDVLLICRSGGRSMAAAEFLDQQGLSVVNVAGGTLAWVASGREVVTGDQPG
jgi:rhodanese-related sulfurtransferase